MLPKEPPMRPSTPQEWLTGMETLPGPCQSGESNCSAASSMRENRAADICCNTCFIRYKQQGNGMAMFFGMGRMYVSVRS